MQRYVIRRLVLSIPVLLIVMVMTFGMMRLVPGDVTMARIQQAGGYNDQALQALRHQLGLDRSLPTQFVEWTLGVAHGDFGRSLITDLPTLDAFAQAARITVELAVVSIVISLLVGIPIGVYSAVFQDTATDYVFRFVATLGLSVPNFFTGTAVVLFAALWFHYQAPYGFASPFTDPWTNFQQMIFPSLILSFQYAAVTMRVMRTVMLEVLRQDYVRTARAKGLDERIVIVKHALRNALIPVITVVASQLAFLLGGTVIVETLFSLPGVGLLTFNAINGRDYTQVQTNLFLLSLIVVFGNLFTDLTYAYLDPRVKYE